MDILRFITAGSVDDGKSTLIGRLLYDSKNILIDQLAQLEKQSRNKVSIEASGNGIDLAYITDGLRAEREQGITIDVAYRYFSTPKRKFIIADTPGHVQYTRNMITGASNANLIIILIDARLGVVEQTRRHTIIASLLRIPHVVVAVNKMDLVNYSQDIFNNIMIEYAGMAKSLGLNDVHFIPVCALQGDNIVDRSEKMKWYNGGSLLHFLENIEIQNDINLKNARFPVQYVIRPQTENFHDYRGYAGKIISGIYKKEDSVTILPSGLKSTIKSVDIGGKEVQEAFAPQSVVIQLEDDIDMGRGDMIVKNDDLPKLNDEIDVLLCWVDNKPLTPGNKYFFQVNSLLVKSVVREIEYKLNVNTLEKEFHPSTVGLNDIVKARIKTASPIPFDIYSELRVNGGTVLIDETSNATVAACMIQ